MEFAEMQTDALDLLHELQNHGQYTSDKLKHYINRGSVEFVKRTMCIEAPIDITTVASQFEYTEADAAGLAYLLKPIQIRYVDSASEVGEPLRMFRGGYTNLPKTKQYGTPSEYWIRNVPGKTRGALPVAFTGARLGTWPICATSAKTLRLDAFLWPVPLVGDTDIPEYKDAWHDAPVYWAAYRMILNFSHLRKGWHDKALELKAIFDEYVESARRDLVSQDDGPFIPIDVVQSSWDY